MMFDICHIFINVTFVMKFVKIFKYIQQICDRSVHFAENYTFYCFEAFFQLNHHFLTKSI